MSDIEIQDCVEAIASLVGRSGATQFEIGYLHDEGEVQFALHGACWWAKAQYRGTRIQVENQPTPAHAADGLAHMILDGGHCTHCGLRTTTDETPTGTYIRGMRRKPNETLCIWYREGNRWKRGCE